MSPLGLGNDIGGSLRNPAYCCGIASIKPSFGRVAQGNESSLIDPGLNSQLMLVQGVLARSVADVRLGLESVIGAHRRDPHAIDAPLVGPKAKKRVALVPEPEGGTTDPGVAAGVRAAGKALEAAGYEVEEVSPPLLTDAYLSWSELMWTSLAVVGPLLQSVMGEGGRAFLDFTSVEYPPRTPESEYLLHTQRYKVAKAFQSFLADYPIMVGPTWTQPPFPLGFDIASKESAWQVVEMFRFVLPANLLGLPAACVPTGLSSGLPTGVQVIGARFREDLCLDAAQSIEDILGTLTPIDPKV
jgi:amidase